VTLSAPLVLVTHLFVEHLARFRAEYPDIRLSLSAQGQQISLSRREADVAVRLVRPDETGTITRKVGAMVFGLYAHRSYAHLAAPERWQFIAFDQNFSDMPQQKWLLSIAGDRPVACELNYISAHLIAVRACVGVAGLPRFIGDRDCDLVRITEDLPPFARDIWLLVHRDLRKNPAVRAVTGFETAVISGNRNLRIR
jgi:DNA-binding transcriptional LysR family regulator